MGGALDGTYRDRHQVLGPCPLHLTTFDLTRHGMVISGHGTEGLPQIIPETAGDEIHAVGVMGLIYSYAANVTSRRA
ncbi:MAG: Arsenite oxidase small subunit domain-containing protein [Rhodospirillaceae bacterium]|nr:MAG: Arsenite oxidase small subunit domain-containing protein [Rhodospirillaceae bacterium]